MRICMRFAYELIWHKINKRTNCQTHGIAVRRLVFLRVCTGWPVPSDEERPEPTQPRSPVFNISKLIETSGKRRYAVISIDANQIQWVCTYVRLRPVVFGTGIQPVQNTTGVRLTHTHNRRTSLLATMQLPSGRVSFSVVNFLSLAG